MRFSLAAAIVISSLSFIPFIAGASSGDVVITEIMYDLSGTDTDREWIEIYNSGTDPVTLAGGSGNDGWRLYETHSSGSHNHTFAAEAYQGDLTLHPGEFAVIAQNGHAFKTDYPSFTGAVLVSSAFTLSNTSQSLGLKIGSGGVLWSEVSYTSALGANGDGKSLQKNGASWIAATPTPGAGFASGGSSSESTSQTSTSGTREQQTSPVLQPESILPRFRADAGEDQEGVAGAPVSFFGRVFGYTNEPLEGGRFLWSFGDGSSAEGRSVAHAYQFPGTYIASVSVSSGYESASDYARITIVPNSVFISELMSGPDGFFELANSGDRDVDIGLWAVVNERSGNRMAFPERTIIPAGIAVAFPTKPAFWEHHGTGDSLMLVYPNNSPAFRVTMSEALKSGESRGIQKDGTSYVQAKPSPGVFMQEHKAEVAAAASPARETASLQEVSKTFLSKSGLPSSGDTAEFQQKTAPKPTQPISAEIRQTGLVAASGMGLLGLAGAISALGVIGVFFIRKFFL